MKILAFPRDANPYQELLYAPMRRRGVIVEYLDGPTGSHTLNMLMMPWLLIGKRLQGFDVLHVHWTYPFQLPFSKGAVARACMEALASATWLMTRLVGMKLVWTAHNARPHEPLFLDDRRAHRFLGNLADRVIVHSAAALQQLREMGVRNDRCTVIAHGNYIGVYPDGISRLAARRHLGLPADATIFLFFGLIRPYKGVEQLLRVFSELQDAKVALIIAGKVQDYHLAKTIETFAITDDRLHVTLDRIADDQLQFIFRAADFTVLPYEKSTTSGVSLLSASYACPIIAPGQAAFADIPKDMQISYAAGGLADALRQATHLSDKEQKVMSAAARRYAEDLGWDNIADQTVAFLETGK
ncbi:MAG TPA: glycosyltransferase [Candidatus Saccharimonadales bacterium]